MVLLASCHARAGNTIKEVKVTEIQQKKKVKVITNQ